MAIATARTSLFGGAASTFTTAASPGAALTTFFSAVDAVLVAAGWTNIYTAGGGNEKFYSSNGESGTETLFLRMTTGAYGTAAGVELSGGSYLTCGLCQYADASGNFYNAFGFARTQSSQNVGNTVVGLEASLTWHYAVVADKDGVSIVCVPTTSHPNAPYWLNTGILSRPAGVNPNNLVTSGTIAQAGGTGITVNVSSNPITAGYLVGDGVMVIAQGGTGGVNHLADIFSTRIIALTTSSVTLEVVPALSQTMATGALIGADPQPFYGSARSTTTTFNAGYSNNNGGPKIAPSAFIGMNTNANQWSAQMGASNGTEIDQNATMFDNTGYINGGPAVASVRPDARTGTWFLDTPMVRNNTSGPTSYRGKPKTRLYLSGRNSFPASLTIEYAKRHPVAATEEWVGFSDTLMNFETWLGPFPVVNATTKRISLVNQDYQSGLNAEVADMGEWVTQTSEGYDDTAIGVQQAWRMTPEQNDTQTAPIQGAMVDIGASTSSDDVQPVLIDQPYPFDYTYAPTNQESPNFNRGFN